MHSDEAGMTELAKRVAEGLARLESADLETRVRAVEALARCSEAIVDRVAQVAAEDEAARFLVFERIRGFGSLSVAAVERVYREAEDASLRLMSASVLLELGNRAGVPDLMAALGDQGQRLSTAALSLSDAGIEEAAGPIEEALMACDFADRRMLDDLATSLRRLRNPLPERVQERLSRVEPAWFRESLLGRLGPY
ncbi:hypothetical protein [Streptomyces sp. NPDC002054]|uniref:hypothetical protein n=1 Tax=Streptomyces sp. NPDC002054 TaxID=3154663 RepID=UPI00331EBC7A